MKKKLISAIVTLAMMFSAMGTFIAVEAEDEVITVAQATTAIEVSFTADKLLVGEGDEISYIASVSGIEGYRGFQTSLKYDTSKLELVSVEPLSVMELMDLSFDITKEGVVGIGYVSEEEMSTTGGDLAKITFKVKQISKDGYVSAYVSGTKVSVDGDNYMDTEYITSVDEVYAYTGQKVEITAVPSAALAIPGETVSYTFNISEVENFKGMQFKLVYDSDILECANIAEGAVLVNAVTKMFQSSDGVIQGMIVYSGDGYTGSGEVFTADFTVKAKAGQTVIEQPDIHFESFTANDYIVSAVKLFDVYPIDPALGTISAINAIGEVGLDDKEAIEYAEMLYAALSDDVRDRVDNYDVLVNARATYDALYAPVQNVINLIKNLGDISLSSKDELEYANKAYEALSNEEKLYVKNYSVLQEANTEYEEIYNAQPTYEFTVGKDAVAVKQNKSCNMSLTLYIAQYTSEKQLAGINTYTLNGDANCKFDTKDNTETVKCFIWDSSMKPFTDVVFN